MLMLAHEPTNPRQLPVAGRGHVWLWKHRALGPTTWARETILVVDYGSRDMTAIALARRIAGDKRVVLVHLLDGMAAVPTQDHIQKILRSYIDCDDVHALCPLPPHTRPDNEPWRKQGRRKGRRRG